MLFLPLFIFVCTTAYIPLINAQNQCSIANYSRHINWKLQCGVFKTIAADFMDCQKTCAATLNCFSINTYRSDNGTEMCDLIRGSQASESEGCFVKNPGSEHNELLQTFSCSSGECKAGQEKRARTRGWYRFGSFKYKHFKGRKTWDKANSTCSVHHASLATINNELELRFLVETILKSITVPDPNIKKNMSALHHWKLDGTDKDVILHGDAIYSRIKAGATNALLIPGKRGAFATTPSIAFQTASLTIALWVKIRSIPTDDSHVYHLYSYWLNPYMFSIHLKKISNTRMAIVVLFRKKSNPLSALFQLQAGLVKSNFWNHLAVTWDRNTKKATLFQNGKLIEETTSSAANGDLDLPSPIRSVFDIGLKRDNPDHNVMDGLISGLAVFKRALSIGEINQLISLTDTMELMRLRGVWVEKTHLYENLVPADNLRNSTCVSMRAWEPYGNLGKMQCDTEMSFICQKPV